MKMVLFAKFPSNISNIIAILQIAEQLVTRAAFFHEGNDIITSFLNLVRVH
jgi:hypothetical protein